MKSGATRAVEKVLKDLLPPHMRSTPSFAEIVSAEFTQENKKRIVAKLKMFDGKPATFECWKIGNGWASKWVDLDGGDVVWNGKAWERENVSG